MILNKWSLFTYCTGRWQIKGKAGDYALGVLSCMMWFSFTWSSGWPPLSNHETFLYWSVWSLPGRICPHPHGMSAQWIVWWGRKGIKSYAMTFTLTTSQLNWTLEWHALHHLKEDLIEEQLFITLVRSHMCVELMPRSTKAVLEACAGSTPH